VTTLKIINLNGCAPCHPGWVERGSPDGPQWRAAVAAALGGRHPRSVTRLRGGSQKGVYRLGFDDEPPVIAYLWDPAENYWPEAGGAAAEGPFGGASGADLFELNQELLESLGVRTPRVYGLDRSQARYPADFALVEDVSGGSLETLMDRDPRAAGPVLARLRVAVDTMAAHRGDAVGKVAHVRAGQADTRPCPRIVLDRALGHLAWAAGREPRLAAARGELEGVLARLADLSPRTGHGLVHGELGPDHVLVDERGEPVIIDIEGLMFFDAEWEHAFLRLRFGPHYRWLRPATLDEERLRLYSLALYLSLVAGPLRLLDGDFPDREPMLEIAEYNLRRALAFAG
jgi:Phosphotransferase enzyme family